MKVPSRRNSAKQLLCGIGAFALISGLTGCSMGKLELSGPDPSPIAGAALKGNVHGGQQGVSGSIIQLWTVGTSGYGSSAVPVGAPVVTDRFGSFTLNTATGVPNYTCPSASALMYITATGGNPGLATGTNNSAIKMVAALGACGNLSGSTFITINEISTAAAAFALGQYFTPTYGAASLDSFGSPSTTQALVGISNAFATVNNLVNLSDGSAVQSKVTGTLNGTSITAVPEFDKLSLIANILASCINSDGGASSTCQTTLFPDVTPTGGTQATDTLQAAVYMSLNPTSNNANGSSANLAALFALSTPTSPFTTAITTQPNDWTTGITFSAGTSSTQNIINVPVGMAIDRNGNIFLINYVSGNTSTTSLSEISPAGVPVTAVNIFGGTSINLSSPALALRNVAIDQNDNVIFTSSSTGGGVFSYNINNGNTGYYPLGGQPYGIAINAANDVVISHNSTSSNTYSFDDFLGGNIAATSNDRFAFDASNTVNQFAAFSTTGNLYLTKGSGNGTSVLQASAFNTTSCTAGTQCTTATATFTPVTTGGISNPYNLAADKNGGMWVADNGANTVTYIQGTTGTSYGSTASFTTPRYVAVDGNNIAWFTDRGTGGNAVSEITSAGVILSPATGGTTGGQAGFFHNNLSTTNGIGIDPSGNIWVPSGNSTAGASAQYSVFEIVGAAAPTVTPISLALKNGTVGAKP